MIGYVTIEVEGPDMESASRHAQRLAYNFLDDLDTMQRESRARDRRAMSHLETGVRSTSVFEPVPSSYRRRHSLSTARSIYGPSSVLLTYSWPTPSSRDYPVIYRRPRIVRDYGQPVMMVGKSIYSRPITHVSYYPPRADWRSQGQNVYDTHRDWQNRFWYDQILANPEQPLPTSSLRAHPPPQRNILSPGAVDYLTSLPRRSYSLQNLYDDLEEPFPRVIHTTVNRRTPIRSSRLSSVPPSTVTSSYRPIFYTSEIGVPPPAPRTYYRTHRYVSETPQYLSSYITRTSEPVKPILSTHYSSSPAPVTRRYTYYYPPSVTSKVYRTGSYTNLLPEIKHERRRIESRMDNLLDYKLPPPEYYRDMRGSLRGLQDRLDEHRRMLDRYSGIDMNVGPSSVADRIETKYQQLASRMGRTSTGTARAF